MHMASAHAKSWVDVIIYNQRLGQRSLANELFNSRAKRRTMILTKTRVMGRYIQLAMLQPLGRMIALLTLGNNFHVKVTFSSGKDQDRTSQAYVDRAKPRTVLEPSNEATSCYIHSLIAKGWMGQPTDTTEVRNDPPSSAATTQRRHRP